MEKIPDWPQLKLGQRMKAARTAAGITSDRLAELLGVSRQYISQIENRRRNNVSPCFLNQATWLLRVSPSYMLGRDVAPMFELMMEWAQAGWLPDWAFEKFDELMLKVFREKDVSLEQVNHRLRLLGIDPLRSTIKFKQPPVPVEFYHHEPET